MYSKNVSQNNSAGQGSAQNSGLPSSALSEWGQRLGLPPSAAWRILAEHRGRSVWQVDCAQDRFVVRILRQGDKQGAAIEEQAMATARRAGLPVPELRACAWVDDRSMLLLDWCHGRALDEELRRRPWMARRLGQVFGELQARLHDATTEQRASQNWIGFFGTVDNAMHERLAQVHRSPCLIHLDFYPGNIVVQHGEISGILDWPNARFGDRRADLARTWTLLRLIFRSGRRRPARRWIENQFFQGWRQGYVGLAGPQPDMAVYLAWAVEGLVRLSLAKKMGTNPAALMQIAGRFRARAGIAPIPLQELANRTSRVPLVDASDLL